MDNKGAKNRLTKTLKGKSHEKKKEILPNYLLEKIETFKVILDV